MHIVYFSDTYLPKIDGIAISISNFTKILSKKGHKFTIFCPSYGEEDFYSSEENLSIYRFPAQNLPSYPDVKVVLPGLATIRKILKEENPDIIHLHTPGMLGITGLQFGLRYDIPVISTYHTLVMEQHEYINIYKLLKIDRFKNTIEDKIREELPLSMELFEKFTFRDLRKKITENLSKKFITTSSHFMYEKSDLILTPSLLIKKELQKYEMKPPIEVMSNGMDLEAFTGKPKKYPQTDNPYDYPWKILHVGRISFEKNCDVLLKSFYKLKEKFKNAQFTIVGDGPALKSLKQLRNKMKMEDSVSFTGFFPHDKLPEIYREYDLFWTASTMETQGLVILEGMACGIMAVGVDSYAIPELIYPGKNGYLAKPFDSVAITNFTEKIFTSKEDFENFSKESIEISKKHELNNCANDLEKIYEKMKK